MGQLEDDKALILGASRYRSGVDSIGSVYMGSHATAGVIHRLGGKYGKDGIEDLLKAATPEQVAVTKEYAQSYITYMLAHPVKKCPCCGQITGVE